jgi:hypothetical protein
MNLSPTDLIAGIALVVSAATAFITWKIHQDAGGRVEVQMNAACYVSHAGRGKLARNNKGNFLLKKTPEPAVELCQIAIENPGRTGVTVTSVALRFEGLNARITVTHGPFYWRTSALKRQARELLPPRTLRPSDSAVRLLVSGRYAVRQGSVAAGVDYVCRSHGRRPRPRFPFKKKRLLVVDVKHSTAWRRTGQA